MNDVPENSQGSTSGMDGEHKPLDPDEEKWRSGIHLALSAMTAALAGGLFSLTQLPPVADWGTTVATYSFAIGLPLAAAGAIESAGEWDSSSVRSITLSLYLVGVAAIVGVTGLFWHFHIGAATVFVVAAVVSMCFFAFSPELSARFERRSQSPQ